MKKWELSLLFGLIITIFLSSFTSFFATCAQVRTDTLRLHILANSDTEVDQQRKLAVRDAILREQGALFSTAQNKAGATNLAHAQLEAIARTARSALVAQGCDDAVSVSLVNMYFATKQYDGFTLPAGRYDAVRVEIGAHTGKNWFCVLFPPLCVPAAEDAAAQTPAYSGKEREVIESGYEIKFAVVEWIESLKNRRAQAPVYENG